ncbi:toxin-antitoxin system, toxin component domain protein, partial [Enterococcus faecalis RP2S-4]
MVLEYTSEEVKQMVMTMNEIKERVKPIAERYEIPVIYVFGSYARDEAKESS